MISRVSAALTKFLSPISSSHSQKNPTQKNPSDFKRFSAKKQDESPQEEPRSKKETKQKQVVKSPSPTSQIKPTLEPEGNFIQLFSLFTDQKNTMLKWLGEKTYPQNNRKGIGKLRKGVMIDKKVG